MKETINFTDSNGLKISGVLNVPEGATKAVLLNHGLGTGKDSGTCIKLQEKLEKQGIATLRIDLYGHGQSEGDFEDLTVSKACDDIRQGLKVLRSKGFSVVGLEGASFSGIASIIVASEDKDLAFLALKAPVSDYLDLEIQRNGQEYLDNWKEVGHKEFFSKLYGPRKIKYAFVEDFMKYNGYDLAATISIPFFIVHGDKDDRVPLEQSKKTCSLSSNCQLEIIEGADHNFTEHKELVVNKLFEFIMSQIG